MLELAMVKRPALYKGEKGLFPVDEAGGEEIGRLSTGGTVWAEVATPKNIALLRFLWALATHLARGGLYDTKDEAMDDLKIRARFARFATEGNRVVIVPRSLSRQRGDVLSRLADRIVFIVCSELLPGMPESELRQEIEKMVA